VKRGEASEREGAGEAGCLPRVWSVTEISREVERRLKTLGRISVEGEVSQLKLAGSGHLYFGLKDLDAHLSCAIWKSRVATALRFELEDGMRVVCHGELDVYKPRGTYSLIVDRVEARGAGDLLARFEALKQELKARGWFDRKRALPAFPHLIGVVTSRDGAALHDFLRTRSLRWPLYPLRMVHTSVQGASAALEIADAIGRLDRSGVDVIVLIRGGGSMEDLWAFNELPVAEAIFAASVPVVSGVGHETDFTLADFVADRRAHTPTDAAHTVVPDRAAILATLERGQAHLEAAIDGALTARTEKLAGLARSPALRSSAWIFGERARALSGLGQHARLLMQGRLERARARLESTAARARAASPLERFLAREKQTALLALRI
jgi:exodeoxyribonuclease VII large subunit